MHKPLSFALLLLLIFSCALHAQKGKVNTDSLWSVYHSSSDDETKYVALRQIANTVRPNFPDSALKIADTMEVIALRQKDTSHLGAINHVRGLTYKNMAQYKTAIRFYLQSLYYWQLAGYDTGVALVHQQMGTVYAQMQDQEKALEQYNAAIAIYEKQGDEEALGGVYSDMGNTCRMFHQDSLAMALLRKSLTIRIKYKNAKGIAVSQANMAGVFAQTGQPDSAIFYTEHYQRFALKTNFTQGIIRSLNNIGEMYNMKGEFARGRDSCMKAWRLNSTFNSLADTKTNCECLYNSYKGLKQYDSAVKYLELHRKASDSLNKISTDDEIARLELEYEYTQRVLSDSLQTAQKLEVFNARSEGEKNMRYALFAGLALTLVFGALMFNRFRVTRKQRNLIAEQIIETEEQKRVIEVKNREITDSINYAQRIQQAILPSEQELKKAFTDIFVLFEPRDIVSGDFYWYDESKHNKVIALADCTGHGVPGGFMSMLGSEILQDVVMLEEITTTAEAMRRLDQKVTTRLNKNDKAYRDGMDMVLCAFPKDKMELHFSGANRPLLHFSNGVMNVIKPDKHTIGGAIDDVQKDFTMHVLPLQKGDMVYLFSDGYADQFGGDNGKKFMSKNLEQLLTSVAPLDCAEQKTKLKATFRSWKGSLEQVDDVCIVGIRI